MPLHPFENSAVEECISSYPESHQRQLLQLRELVFQVAEELQATGGIEETLKWGQPSYLPMKPRVGSTVRLGRFDDTHVALYFHCQTTLVESFRSLFGNEFKYSKYRAVLFGVNEPLPEEAIKICLRMALYYHYNKRVKA